MTNKWIAAFGACLLAMQLTGCSDSAVKADPAASEIPVGGAVESDKPSPPAQDPSIVALVNKQQSLDETYVPDDLVTVDVPTVLNNPEVNQLRREAAGALKEMFDKAADAGIKLYARSGYRSFQTQRQLFENYAAKHGEEAANRYSARAGQSEHQTGLVMDVTSESVNLQLEETFGETAEGEWLSEHAHEFGFIIRYPKGQEKITGYIYEPWHIRYLGTELAGKVYTSGLTYEEYLEKEKPKDEIS
ncbi:M15 family metallopeptidase [Paenibacillus sp. IITD108]|uniref:M15 family metallopeptidase n=1 Tax=Paenibacillus sp. IITD108 TaxID=3116649 RepID=UPI002F416322